MQRDQSYFVHVVVGVAAVVLGCGGSGSDTASSTLAAAGDVLPDSALETTTETLDVTKAGSMRVGPSYDHLTEAERAVFANPGNKRGTTTQLHQLLTGTAFPRWDTVDVLPYGPRRFSGSGASGEGALLYFTETWEVRFTQEIQDLARKLDYDPVKIYNWVYNHIAYEPYDWSRKGGQVTYWNKRGNEWDTSSLLIALLRIAGHPARYRRGRFYKSANWLVETVYVEVWLPDQAYWEELEGGIAPPDAGIWYPLVPWLKDYEVHDPGFNAFAHVSSPTALEALEAFPEEYLASPTHESAVEVFADRLLEYIQAQDVGIDSLSQVPRRREIVRRTSSLLPRSLPRSVQWDLTGSNRNDTSDIHDRERVWIDFRFTNNRGKAISDVKRVYLPQVAGHHLSFSVSDPKKETKGTARLHMVITPATGKSKTIFLVRADLEEFPLNLEYKSAGEDTFSSPPDKSFLFSDSTGKRPLGEIRSGSQIGVAVDDLSSSAEVVNHLKSSLVTDVANSVRTSPNEIASVLAQDYARRFFEDQTKLYELLHRHPNANRRSVFFAKVEDTDISSDLTPFALLPNVTFHIGFMLSVGTVARPNGADVSPPAWQSTAPWSDAEKRKFSNILDQISLFAGSYAESEVIEDWIWIAATSSMAGVYQAQEQDIEVVRITKQANLNNGRAYYSPAGSPDRKIYFDQKQSYGKTYGDYISVRLRSPGVGWMILPSAPIELPDGSRYLVYFGDRLGATIVNLDTGWSV